MTDISYPSHPLSTFLSQIIQFEYGKAIKKVRKIDNVIMFRARKKVQIGRGVGGVVLRLLPRIIPVLKTAFKWISGLFRGKTAKKIVRATAHAAAKSAAQAGVKTLQDAVTGENIGKSLKKNITTAGNEVLSSAIKQVENSISNSPPKSKPGKKESVKEVKLKKRPLNYLKTVKSSKKARKDIFQK